MARFMGKKSLEKSNRNKANRSNFSIDQTFQSIENFYRFVLPFNLPTSRDVGAYNSAKKVSVS